MVDGIHREKPIAAGKSSFDFVDQEKLFSELHIKDDTILLDAACGRGDYSLAAAAHIGKKGRIFAFDLWESGINHLIDEIMVRGITCIIPRIADICLLPLGDGTIDVCLMATVLHDLVQDGTDQRALEEIKRVFKPDGILAVIEFKKISGPPGPPVNVRISPAELDERLWQAGFTPVNKQEIIVGEYTYLSLYRKTPENP